MAIHAHLTAEVRVIADLDDGRRIAHLAEDHWIDYPRARQALPELERLVACPERTRMPGLLLHGESNIGLRYPVHLPLEGSCEKYTTKHLCFKSSAEPQKDCLHDSVHHVLGNATDTDAAAVAIVRAVESLMGELKPLVGGLAAFALYARSLHLANASFEKLDPALQKLEGDITFLRNDLSARSFEEARTASHALLRALVDLLASLIGQSLTDRLLHSARGNPNAGHSPEKRT